MDTIDQMWSEIGQMYVLVVVVEAVFPDDETWALRVQQHDEQVVGSFMLLLACVVC